MTSKLRVNNDTEFNVTGLATRGKYTINCTGKGTSDWCEVERDSDSEHCVQLTISGVPWMDNNISVYVRIRDKNGSKDKRIGISGSGYKDAENNWSTYSSSKVINGLKCSCSIPDTSNPEGKVRIEVDDTGFNLWGQKLEKEGNAATNQATKKEKFEAARLKFEEAERVTTDQSSKTLYRKNQALMLSKIGDILRSNADYNGSIQKYDEAIALTNDKDIKARALCKQGCALDKEGIAEGNQATKQRKYEAARLKFEEAERVTTDESNRTLYRNNQALMLEKIGDIIDNSGDYNESISKYRLAHDILIQLIINVGIEIESANEKIRIANEKISNKREHLLNIFQYIFFNPEKEIANANQHIVYNTDLKNKLQNQLSRVYTSITKVQLEITAKAAFEQAERLYNSGDYDGGLNKYREAHSTSRVIAVKTTYNNGITKARAELDAIALKGEGDNAFNEGRYADAKAKYQAAYNKSTVVREKEKYTAGITRAEVEIEARLAEARGDSIVAAANESLLEELKEALAEYRQASEISMIKENKDRCLDKVEDLELMITIKESEEQFRQEQDSREQIELSTVIIKSLQEFEEELTKKVIEESRKTYSDELYRKGLDHKERGDEEYAAEDEGAAHGEYRDALDKFKEAIKYGKPEAIITALRKLKKAFSKLAAEEDVSDTDRVLDELGGGVPVVTDIQTQNPNDCQQGINTSGDVEHKDGSD